jgi:glutamate mutase epsilon subunit
MAKVVVASLKSKPNGRRDTISVTEKRVRDTEGQVRMLRILDAGSLTFGKDLQYVFGKNVAKARRDNKRAIGAADVVPKR